MGKVMDEKEMRELAAKYSAIPGIILSIRRIGIAVKCQRHALSTLLGQGAEWRKADVSATGGLRILRRFP